MNYVYDVIIGISTNIGVVKNNCESQNTNDIDVIVLFSSSRETREKGYVYKQKEEYICVPIYGPLFGIN